MDPFQDIIDSIALAEPPPYQVKRLTLSETIALMNEHDRKYRNKSKPRARTAKSRSK